MSIFKTNPLRKIEREYEKKLLEIRDMQRAGDIQRLAALTEESQELLKKIEVIKGSQ